MRSICSTFIAALAVCLLTLIPSSAQEKSIRPGINKDFENPDPKEYVQKFERESREIAAQAKEIVAACKLKPGMAVADVGAGTGLFSRKFAAAVGDKGKVFAVDIAPNFLRYIDKTCQESGIKNVKTIQCDQFSTRLPKNSVDLVFICDTYHHFEFPQKTLASIHEALRPSGQIILIDFHRIEGKSRWFVLWHVRAGQEVFVREIKTAGFKLVSEEKFLKENYFVRFEKLPGQAAPILSDEPSGEIGANVKDAKGLQAALKNLHAPRVLSGPLPAHEAHKRLKAPAGFAVDLLLSEPVVRQPLFTTFDERGRLWVVQYLQYPFPAGLKVVEYDQYIRARFDKVPPPPPHHFRGADRITIHESTRGDGVFDKHRVFVSGLNIATSVLPGRGGVWVLNPPYLLFYPDKNRNDVPDGDPQVHLSGFGLEDTHAVANSLAWGPDGWIYGAQGSTCTAKVRVDISGSPATTDFMGQVIWRYHPERHVFEIFAEGGGNTFGVEFDDKGRLYSGTNGDARGVYYVQGGYYRKAWGKHGPLTNPYALGFYEFMPHSGNRERFTHTFVDYGGDSLPESLGDKLIAVNPLQKRVQVARKVAVGSGYRTVEEPFLLTSSDGWFRPVDIHAGPDGALYICDFYEARISHVDPRDNWDRGTGRIYRLRAAAAKPVGRIDLASLTSAELVCLLAHQNRWHRQTALRLLGDRKDVSVLPLLRRNLENGSGQLALESLWALYQVGGLDEAVALRGLRREDAFVRMWTVRLLGDDRQVTSTLAERLRALARDETHPQVRSQLASSARRWPASVALPVLRNLIAHREDVSDPHIPLLIWWALEAKAESDRSRVVSFFDDLSLWREPIAEQFLLEGIVQRYALAGGSENLRACAALLRLPRGPAQANLLLTGLEKAFAGRAIAGVSKEFQDSIRHALSIAGPTPAALTLGVRLGSPRALDEALQLLGNHDAATEDRVRVIRVLAEASQPRCIPALLDLLKTAPDTVRVEALTALARYEEPAIGKAVLPLVSSKVSAPIRSAALTVLASRTAWARDLLLAVDAGSIRPSSVPVDVVRRINLHHDAQLSAFIHKHWGRLSPATSQEKQAEILRLVKVGQGGKGDGTRGRDVFAATCAKCHKLFGEGGVVGPDLTGYERDNLLFWVENIVDPSAAIREEYTTTVVETKDGRVLTGILAEQDPRSILLRDGEGKESRLARDDIQGQYASGQSLMPEDQMRALSEQQVRDLFAYLMKER
jgi:putative heme-binding domain-containing protein